VPTQVINVFGVFRNFGCGATLVSASVLSFKPEYLGQLVGLVNELDNVNQNLSSILLVIAIFVMYAIGSTCLLFGEILLDVLPNRSLEKQLELQAELVNSNNSYLFELADRFYTKSKSLGAGFGLGSMIVLLQVVFAIQDLSFINVLSILLGFSLLFTCFLSILWTRKKFETLMLLINSKREPSC